MSGIKAIGLMSGTSVDSIDAAVIDIEELKSTVSVKNVTGISFPISEAVRNTIFHLFEDPKGSLRILTMMNMVIGELFAEAVEYLLDSTGLRPEEITVIGSHGQTVYHLSDQVGCCGRMVRGSLQIGEGSVIAQRTGIPVISDFRTGDIAAGGSGAPLVPFLDLILSDKFGSGTAFQNIGGIGNVTYLSKDLPGPVAFDTGPGNMIIDRLVEIYTQGEFSYDKDGEIGSRGEADDTLLEKWMSHPYFLKKPPKSTGREEFGTAFFDSFIKGLSVDENLIRTAEEFTVRSIVTAYREHLEMVPATLVVAGGGAHNPVIMNSLRREMKECRILTGDEAGISTDFKEAAAFALMGYYTLTGKTNNVPSATGAAEKAVMGKLSLPRGL